MTTELTSRMTALERVANEGASRAARSLSAMTGRRMQIHMPVVRTGSREDACRAAGGPRSEVLGCSLEVTGDEGGRVVVVFPVARALQCVKLMPGMDARPGSELDELATSALLELSNIATSAFVNALADELHLKLQPSPPVLERGTAADLVQPAPAEGSDDGPGDVLIADAVFQDHRGSSAGLLVFAPRAGGLDRIAAAGR